MNRWLLLVGLLFACPCSAAEITSNGTGGGLWSSPSTWRGGKVPGPDDEVFLRKYDVITFDKNDTGKASCQKLQIDPKGILQFKTGAGKVVCVINGPIDNYGVIKLDGTRSAQDYLELRLANQAQPHIKLEKGSGLLLYGKANLPGDKKNVVLQALGLVDEKKGESVGLIDIDGQVALDWQKAQIIDIKLAARNLDNTGAKPNERIQIMECQFQGQARLLCHTCDTPVISRNSFDYQGKTPLGDPAINTAYCPLAEIKNNQIRGKYPIGISINYQSDASVVGNIIEDCVAGIQGGYGIPSTMVKQVTIQNCETGLKLEGASGVVEEVTISGAKTALVCENSKLQFTNVVVKDLDKKGDGLLHLSGSVSLLNCTLKPEQIKVVPPKTLGMVDAVICHQYVMVKVVKAPENALVDILTANHKGDAADPNVRNSPAPLLKGRTPEPRTLNPLIVKSWSLDPKGTLVPAPEYQVKVLGPAAKEGDARPVLKMQTFRPPLDAFRPNLEDDTPTLEVSLK
jgi:hypothetical protein